MALRRESLKSRPIAAHPQPPPPPPDQLQLGHPGDHCGPEVQPPMGHTPLHLGPQGRGIHWHYVVDELCTPLCPAPAGPLGPKLVQTSWEET